MGAFLLRLTDARAARVALDRLLEAEPLELPDRFGDAIEHFVALLLEANQRLNLTRVVEPEAIARLHLLDSVSALPMIDAAPTNRGLDLGSGGGVPGLVLAIARPRIAWTLVDSVRKKADALIGFVAALGLSNVAVIAERAEVLGRYPEHRETYDLVTARACAVASGPRRVRASPRANRRAAPCVEGPARGRRAHRGRRGFDAPAVAERRRSCRQASRRLAITGSSWWRSTDRRRRATRVARASPRGDHSDRAGRAGSVGILGSPMRIAVLSDIHANLPALEAVIADLSDVDEMWVLGDTVGYGPQPNEVIEALQRAGARSVLGNHDGAAIGVVNARYFNPDARAAIDWTSENVDVNARGYLATLPEVRRDGGLTAVHGSPRDPIWEYITTSEIAAANFGAFDTRLCLFGHTHQPVAFRSTEGSVEAILGLPDTSVTLDVEARFLLNPGSVGQPRDGLRDAAYAILELGDPNDSGVIEFRRVGYDVDRTQELDARGRPAAAPRGATPLRPLIDRPSVPRRGPRQGAVG